MVIKIIWKSSNEKESYGHMGGDSLINAVSVLPLKFGQNYWVIPLLTGACSFGIRERGRGEEERILWWNVGWYWMRWSFYLVLAVYGFYYTCKAKPLFFFSLSCFLHKFDPWYSHFCSTLHNSPFITSFVFFFFRLYMIQQRLKKLLRGISKEWIYRICFVFEIVTLILAPLIQKEVRISWKKA